jgi:iron complex outermembrane recepter protein
MEKFKTLNQISKIMRFTVLQLIILSLSLTCLHANTTNAQNILKERLTLSEQNAELKNVLAKIEEQMKVSFTYSAQKISIDEIVSVEVNNEPLNVVLNQLFAPLAIDYKVYNDRTIILTKGVLQTETLIFASGKVSDESGAPLVGASIIEKGTSNGTITDNEGAFSFNVNDGAILAISYTGYVSQEVAAGTNLSIVLKEGVDISTLTVLGSRGKPRTDADRPVPIDIISAKELSATGQQDIGQSLHYTAPSFSAVKFGINDLAPLVDPASLRGLSPDQTLVLVNGKRRHKVAFFSNNSGVGKGQLANDINAIPSAAVKRVEILRDGAAAQYGSDAIAGVMNMQLNDSRTGGSVRTYTGVTLTAPKFDEFTNKGTVGENIYGDGFVSDGATFSTGVNFGMPWGDKGFVNTTLTYAHSEPTDRSGTYSHSAGWYTPAQIAAAGFTTDAELIAARGLNMDRAILGTAENTNMGIFVNAGNQMNENWDFYMFGGITQKEVIGGVFSRSPTYTARAVTQLLPNGYNPEVPSELTDWQISTGVKGTFGDDWKADFSVGYSGNNVDLYARNTVNPSMGVLSPTQFYTGSLNVTQTVINADINKTFDKTTVAFGVEQRFESFQQSQGQIESYFPGVDATKPVYDSTGAQIGVVGFKDVGASGREGFTDRSAGEWYRNNTGIYLEVESDITDAFLLAGAVRYENYSDFGGDFSYKLASRYKVTDKIGLRGSINRSFRAPGLAQYQYSNFAQIQFDINGNSIFNPILPLRDQLVQQAFGFSNLNPETSFDIALGVTAQLSTNFTATIDAYQISIDDRIVALGGIDPDDFSQFNGAGYNGITIFTNALDTKTQGLDIVLNYNKAFTETSKLGVTVAANFNKTTDEGVNLPAALAAYSVDNNDLIYLLKGSPTRKIIGSVNYQMGTISVLLRATNFGEVTEPEIKDADGNPQVMGAKTVVDLALTGNISEKFSITLGANNLFDVYPDMLSAAQVRNEVIYSRRVNQFGTMGRFINLSLDYNF